MDAANTTAICAPIDRALHRDVVPILAYHSVGAHLQTPRDRFYNISRNAFKRHLRLLKCLGYEGVTLGQACGVSSRNDALPRRPVCITFDDAYTNVARVAAPLLSAIGWPATVFVPTAYVGGLNGWDREEGVSERAIMDWQALRALNASGWEIGAHSRSHCRLSRESEDAARREIAGSKKDVENEIGAEVYSFAYPYGDASAQLAELVRQEGFHIACTCEPRMQCAADLPLLAPRIVIRRYNEGAAALFYRMYARPRPVIGHKTEHAA